MAKEYRKQLSFNAGELSPRFFGRSDTDIYANGLAIAENVLIDTRGGAFKRGGLEHFARIPGNNARLFTLQVSRVRFYTIIIYYDTDLAKGQLLIIAPGARLLGDNLLSNGNFANAATDWNETVTPASSRVVFSIGEAKLLPEQNDTELVDNYQFQQQGVSWTVRQDNPSSLINFSVGSVELLPRQQLGGFAGVAQQVTTATVGEIHSVTLIGDFGSGSVSLKIGTTNGGNEYLDVPVENLSSGKPIAFTPGQASFWVTVDSEFPNVIAVVNSISVLEPIAKTAAISQQATVVAAITDLHLVSVGQSTAERIDILIGTTEGAADIAQFETTSASTQVTFVPNNATYWVTILADGKETVEANINFVGTAAEAAVDPLGVRMDAPWTEDQVDEIHATQVPSGNTLYFTHPNVPVQKLVYDFLLDAFTTLVPVAFLNPPAEWTGTNYPGTGTHFQGRLWLAGSPGQGQTIWGSASGSPEDFTVTADSDASSLEFTLQEFGRIEWMLGTKNLLIGAENGEHIITSTGGIITPQDFQIEQQSAYGSNNMQGIQVGERVFYLTPDGRKLRSIAYEWQENNWVSKDLTFASEHITAGIGRHSCWAQNPSSLFLLELEDGTIAALTYDRTAEANAWTRIVNPGMANKDLTTGRRNGNNEIVTIGQRVAGFLDIDSYSPDQIKLDSYVAVFDPDGTNIITGLDHLEGETVRPIVDGAINPLEVVVGGQITTQQTGQQLYAGMPYTATIKTLPPDIPQNQIRSWKKRWNKVWALMYDSKAPIINGVRPPDRTPSTPMDTVEPDTSGHYKTVNLGWDDFGQITIEEDLPVNMNVLAIYGEMGTEAL